jgi:hypothetical protein
MSAFWRPCQVISREEKLVVVKQNRVSSGMPWNWQNQQISSQLQGVGTGGLDFDAAGPHRNIIDMENALAAEVISEFLMIGNIVPVGEIEILDTSDLAVSYNDLILRLE